MKKLKNFDLDDIETFHTFKKTRKKNDREKPRSFDKKENIRKRRQMKYRMFMSNLDA